MSDKPPRCACNGRTCPACTPAVLDTVRREARPPAQRDPTVKPWR